MVWLAACTTLPKGDVERALYNDVKKAIGGEERLGWTVDRVEIAEATAHAEPSLCRASKARRVALHDWVRAEIQRMGGPAKLQYQRGKDIDDLDKVIDLERVSALLDHAELHLPEDCPFWVKEEPHFGGLHTTSRRFILTAESMGAGSLLISQGRVQTAGGGAARVLPGYGITERLQLSAGFEAGGDAILEKDENGDLQPAGAFRFGVPVILRLHQIDWIYDAELAATSRLKNGKLEPIGARVAFAGGVSGLRRLGFMPAIQLYVAYEIYPEQSGYALQHVLRLGTRVGVDWDP